MKYCIAIDGGGTKTEGVLTDNKGTVLARAMGGASNPNDVTLTGAMDVLTGVVDALLERGGLTADDLPRVSLFGGIAGGINNGPALEAAMREAYPAVGALGICSDVQILLSGELPEGDGACIICGTGSVCFLRRGEELIRIGGWGYLLDSGGSGYDIGRDALEAVLRAHDGRGEPTTLTERLTAHLGGEVHTRITEIYREGKPYIAACAPCVFAAAKEGDAVALAILRRNARALAEYIEAAWAHAGLLSPGISVVMGGSISQREADVWLPMIASQTNHAVFPRFIVAKAPPVFGAVVEAVRQSGPRQSGPRQSGPRPNGREGVDFSALKAAFLDSYGK